MSAAEGVPTAEDAAALLIDLYAASPEGFVKMDADSEPVRAIGKRLDEAGGFELMLEAHALFAAQRPDMARNLEMVWDSIGTWAG